MESVPLHQRIRADVERKILSGEWPPGHRIPFEHELLAEYSCSRMTVNKVLSGLAAAGLIERRRKAGSFVARPRMQSAVLDIPDLEAEILGRGEAYRYELLSSHRRRASLDDAGFAETAPHGALPTLDNLRRSRAEAAAGLPPSPRWGGWPGAAGDGSGGVNPGLEEKSPLPSRSSPAALSDPPSPSRGGEEAPSRRDDSSVLELTCRHFAGETPFVLEERLINLDAVPEAAAADFSARPPGTWLLEHVPWTEAEHRIVAVNAGKTYAAALGIAPETACMLVERRTWREGRTITRVRQIFPGNVYSLTARFTPAGR